MIKIEQKGILKTQLYANSMHWANRDFSEYRNAAQLIIYLLFEDGSLKSIKFLVRGIVDKRNDITNIIVILTKLQKVKLDSSNSPNEIVR